MFFGDFMCLLAVTKINKGDEITVCYNNACWPQERRLIGINHDFTCQCPLCQEDRASPPEIRNELNKIMERFQILSEDKASPISEIYALLGQLQDPKLAKHKKQGIYPEIGKVVHELLTRHAMLASAAYHNPNPVVAENKESVKIAELCELAVKHLRDPGIFGIVKNFHRGAEMAGSKLLCARLKRLLDQMDWKDLDRELYKILTE